MIIDAHQHFWAYDPVTYDWITDPVADLRRDFLPAHLRPALDAAGVERTILVQAAETLDDNPFMLEMAAEAGFVGGIVAWLDLAAPDAVSHLERFSEEPLIKGVRPVLQGIEDTDWILRPEVLHALSHLPGLGLRFDALIVPRHLDTIARLIDLLPDLPIVIDHAAKPVIADRGSLDPAWTHGMARLAEAGHVHCKLSGIAFEQGADWTREGLQPVADHLIEHFGPQRLMWGSDWPVLAHVGTYAQWFGAVQEMIAGCDAAGRAAVLGGTAAAFYGVTIA